MSSLPLICSHRPLQGDPNNAGGGGIFHLLRAWRACCTVVAEFARNSSRTMRRQNGLALRSECRWNGLALRSNQPPLRRRLRAGLLFRRRGVRPRGDQARARSKARGFASASVLSLLLCRLLRQLDSDAAFLVLRPRRWQLRPLTRPRPSRDDERVQERGGRGRALDAEGVRERRGWAPDKDGWGAHGRARVQRGGRVRDAGRDRTNAPRRKDRGPGHDRQQTGT